MWTYQKTRVREEDFSQCSEIISTVPLGHEPCVVQHTHKESWNKGE